VQVQVRASAWALVPVQVQVQVKEQALALVPVKAPVRAPGPGVVHHLHCPVHQVIHRRSPPAAARAPPPGCATMRARHPCS
jgi:hypothetical protein